MKDGFPCTRQTFTSPTIWPVSRMKTRSIRSGLMGVLLVCVVMAMAHAETPGAGSMRAAAMAGTGYPADAEQLAVLVDYLLDDASPPPVESEKVRALVVPHAGYNFSGPAAAAAYKLVQGHSYRRALEQ